MKKLNNKGYMLVEIIVASVIAFSVAYYLINLTSKFMNMNEDVYYSDIMLANKINITKNIMNDLDKNIITDIRCSIDTNKTLVSIKVSDNTYRNIIIDTVNKKIEYGLAVDETSSPITTDSSYYVKKLDSYMEIGTPECIMTSDNTVATINIPISNYYEDKIYGIKLILEADREEVES